MKRTPSNPLVALVCTALAAGCARSKPAEPARLDSQPAALGSAAPAAPRTVALDTHTRGWDAGRAYTYGVGISTAVSFEQGATVYDFDLTGTLELSTFSRTHEAATLHAGMKDVKLVSRLPQGQAELDRVAREVEAGDAFLSFTGGRASELRVPAAQSTTANGIYRQIACALQFSAPSGSSVHYDAEEYDTTGRYLAAYDLAPDGAVWHKVKQRYFGLLGVTQDPSQPVSGIVPQLTLSQGDIRVNSAGRPEHVKFHDELKLEGGQLPMRSSVSIRLDAVSEIAARAPEADLAARFAGEKRFGAGEALGVAAPVEALDAARIGTLDFDTIVSRMVTAAQKAKDDAAAEARRTAAGEPAEPTTVRDAREQARVQEDMKLFVAASALFRQEPATVTQAVRAIEQDSLAAPALVSALASAATPKAQSALLSLMSSKTVTPELKSRATSALARTPKPTEESEAAFRAILVGDPFNRRAMYGLGTFSHRLRDSGDSKKAREIGEFLVAKLPKVQGQLSLVTTLRAIANSGYAGALTRVTPYLSDDRESVRAAAIRALQSMQDPRVDGIIAARMQSDASPEVRISAMDAANIRTPTKELTSGLTTAVNNSSDAHVRYRAVELMARWLPQRPDLRAALEQIAQKDVQPEVRDRAKAAL